MNPQLFFAVWLCAGLLAAQQVEATRKASPPPRPSKAERGEQQAREMRAAIRDGKVRTSHVKVRVRLKNGNRLTGVVKDGRLVERLEGLRFVEAEAGERGAGIRLWYTSGTRSQVFVPFADLQDYEVVQSLTRKELKSIEERLQQPERVRRAPAATSEAKATEVQRVPNSRTETITAGRRPRRPPPPPDGLDSWDRQPLPSSVEISAPPAPDAPSAPAAPVAPSPEGVEVRPATPPVGGAEADRAIATAQQLLVWSELLRKFPPKMGWNAARKDEISRRLVVVGANPSVAESEFVAQFTEWLRACQHHGIAPDVTVAKPPETKRDRRRLEHSRRRGRGN